jgi:hypothetical protein
MVRTYSMPKRTVSGPGRVATASDAFTSGRNTLTPCLRASATNVCGDQNPIGWAFNNPAKKAAG